MPDAAPVLKAHQLPKVVQASSALNLGRSLVRALTDAPRRTHRDRRTLRHEIMAMLMNVVASSVVATLRLDMLSGCKVDRMAMRRSKICPLPRELARLHSFRRGQAMCCSNFLQCRQELTVVSKLCVLVSTLGGCGDLFGKRAHPIVPGKVAFAVQQYHERKGLGLPRLPERWGFVQIDRDGSAHTTRSR